MLSKISRKTETFNETTRILLVDDHAIAREGLRNLFKDRSEAEIIGEAKDGREAVAMALELCPNVVIMSVPLPLLNSVEATQQITSSSKKIKIIALSTHSSKEYAEGMLKAGASAYLAKDCLFEELVQAIHAVREDQTYLSPKIATMVVEKYVHGKAGLSGLGTLLSEREKEVLTLIAEGKKTKEIASALKLSPKTVEIHRRRIKVKLGVSSTAELTKYAVREGFSPL
jgi:DNA-binding NarL/FixJ family response regulator